jgi:hypothetical protein
MRADLAGKSKTVSQVNDTLQQIFTFSAKFGIHNSRDSLVIQGGCAVFTSHTQLHRFAQVVRCAPLHAPDSDNFGRHFIKAR